MSDTASDGMERARELFLSRLVELRIDNQGNVVIGAQDTDTEDEWADALSTLESPEGSVRPDETDPEEELSPEAGNSDTLRLDEAVGGSPDEPAQSKVEDPEEKDKSECPLCYAVLDAVLIGVPDGCEHRFCVDCLQDWVKNSNSCPIDRHRFNALHVFCGEEWLDTVMVSPVQVEMAPPMELSLADMGSTGAERRVRRQASTTGWRWSPLRRLGQDRPALQSSSGVTAREAHPVRSEMSPVRPEEERPQMDWAAVRAPLPDIRPRPSIVPSLMALPRVGPSRPVHLSPGDGTMLSGRHGPRTRIPTRAETARKKYQHSTLGRPRRIQVPGTANPLIYKLSERLHWARVVTATLPLPSNALEARHRIRSPCGEPFPFYIPKWANYWHLGRGRQDARGSPRGGRKAKHFDMCKLLWLEGFPQSSFPSMH